MTGAVSNPGMFISGLDKSVDRFEKKFQQRVRGLVHEGMRRMLAKTPVQTGQAVANYVATGGAPYTGPVKLGGGAQAGTNRMALGPERNRGTATAQAMASLSTVDFLDPYKAFYITNRAPHIGGLEAGALPRNPYTPRSPQGMFAVTVQELLALLSSGNI